MNSYKGYSLFNDVENKALQAWNRFVVMMNILKDTGSEAESTNYVNHFENDDKVRIKETGRMIEENGVAAVRATLNA